MTWTPTAGEREVATSALPPILRARCELLLLRMRIEEIAKSLPVDSFASTFGRLDVRLWAVVNQVPPEKRSTAEARVRQVRRIYKMTSAYLHSRRASIVPPRTELSAWTASVAALEHLVAG